VGFSDKQNHLTLQFSTSPHSPTKGWIQGHSCHRSSLTSSLMISGSKETQTLWKHYCKPPVCSFIDVIVISSPTVPFQSIWQAMLSVTCLPKFWFWHMREMTVAQIFFQQIPASKRSGEGGSSHGKRKEKVPNQHYTVFWRHYNEDMADMCVDCSILGNLSISQAWVGPHFNLLTQRVLHNS